MAHDSGKWWSCETILHIIPPRDEQQSEWIRGKIHGFKFPHGKYLNFSFFQLLFASLTIMNSLASACIPLFSFQGLFFVSFPEIKYNISPTPSSKSVISERTNVDQQKNMINKPSLKLHHSGRLKYVVLTIHHYDIFLCKRQCNVLEKGT